MNDFINKYEKGFNIERNFNKIYKELNIKIYFYISIINYI